MLNSFYCRVKIKVPISDFREEYTYFLVNYYFATGQITAARFRGQNKLYLKYKLVSLDDPVIFWVICSILLQYLLNNSPDLIPRVFLGEMMICSLFRHKQRTKYQKMCAEVVGAVRLQPPNKSFLGKSGGDFPIGIF